MVQVEVRQHDVELLDSLEQVRPLEQPRDPSASVEHQRRVAFAQQRTRGVSAVCRQPSAAAEHDHRLEHRPKL